VGVAGPLRPYLPSIAARISRSGFPAFCMAVTSRVTSRQMVQVAAWLVYVTLPSRLNALT
jgi:hypothetical protein